MTRCCGDGMQRCMLLFTSMISLLLDECCGLLRINPLDERRRRQRRQPLRVSHTLALGRSCAQPHRVTFST